MSPSNLHGKSALITGSSKGLGSRVVNALSTQLHGELDWTTSTSGTDFTLLIPLSVSA